MKEYKKLTVILTKFFKRNVRIEKVEFHPYNDGEECISFRVASFPKKKKS